MQLCLRPFQANKNSKETLYGGSFCEGSFLQRRKVEAGKDPESRGSLRSWNMSLATSGD